MRSGPATQRAVLTIYLIVIAAVGGGLLVAISRGQQPAASPVAASSDPDGSLVLVVMDPLAKELSCPCVQGYAQRDYHALSAYLTSKLGRRVEIEFSESLPKAVGRRADGRADVVIGKSSVVIADAARLGRKLVPLAALSGKDGSLTQTGLVVVRTADPAQSAADLTGYRLLFGPKECDEKHAAAMTLLRKHGVALPTEPETVEGCEEGATTILELPADERGAAVISSYARPLLVGCGTVPKGAIRVVGETAPVPFVVAFAADNLPESERIRIAAALTDVASEPALMIALETQRGFVAESPASDDPIAKKSSRLE